MFQPGDILACYGTDFTSRSIRLGTAFPLDPWSCIDPPSHVGIIVGFNSADYVIESTTKCSRPCLYRGEIVSGVQMHDPAGRIADYRSGGGRVDLYRLTCANQLNNLDRSTLSRLLFDCYLDQQIDYDTWGAFRSALRLRRLLKRGRTDLTHVFCSELIAHAMMRINRLNLTDPALFSPGRLINELLRLGIYRLHQRDATPLAVYPQIQAEAA